MKKIFINSLLCILIFGCAEKKALLVEENQELRLQINNLQDTKRTLNLQNKECQNRISQLQTNINGLEKEKKQLNTEVRKLNEKALAHTIEEIESAVNVSHNAQSKKHSKSKKLDEAVSSPFGDGGGGQKFGGGMGSPGFGRLIRLNAPRPMPQTDYSGQVVIQLTVNDKGVVISAKSTSATTHPDQNVIKLVVDHVKKNVKFKAQPGAYIRTAYYTVQIEAG